MNAFPLLICIICIAVFANRAYEFYVRRNTAREGLKVELVGTMITALAVFTFVVAIQ